jgi:PST family polysaccharide transporter
MGSFGLMLSLITFVLAPVIIKTVLGDGFASSVVILRVLSLLPLVQSIVTVLGTQIMLPLGKDKDFTKIVFGSAIINFALVVLFARALGGVGSAVALVSAESYVMFMMFIFVIYKIRGKTDIASSREIRTTNQ